MQYLDCPDHAGVGDVCSSARLDVRAHLHDPDLVSWRDASLVKLEAEYFLGLGARQELGVHRYDLHNSAVGLKLDGLQLLFCDALEVR